MAVTRIEEGGLGTDSFNLPITLNGTDGSSTDAGDNLVLDASASGVDAGERLLYNGIPPDLAGNFSSNVNVLSGVTLTIDDGATIVNSGTATGFGSNEPTSADGQALGSASAEWSDLYLADGGIVYFGNDQEITLTHSADSGLLLKHTATADDKPINLVLQTGETDMAANDVLGKISFQAPDEGTGTDSRLIAAAIQAVSDGDFSSSSNATRLEFMTGSSEAATSQMTISSGGIVGIGATLPGDLGVGLHIKTSDSGASVNAAEDELVIESSGDVGMALVGGTSSTASIVMGDSSSARSGRILYHLGDDYMEFLTASSSSTFRAASGIVYVNETSNSDMTIGMTINQGANDNEAFCLKSSDVANTTFTGTLEADTYLMFDKHANASGGWNSICGTESNNPGFHDYFHETQPAAGASGTVTGVVCWRGVVTADSYAYAADKAIFTWRKSINGGSSRVLACIDEDGDFHLDAVSSDNSFDKYDDALLCRSVDLTIAKPKSIIKSEFDSWTDDHRERLTEVGILNRTDPSDPNCWHYPEDAVNGSPASKEPPWYDDTPLLNTTQLQRLHNGAIVQQRLMFETLKEVAEEMIPGFANKLNERLESKRLPALPIY